MNYNAVPSTFLKYHKNNGLSQIKHIPIGFEYQLINSILRDL